MPDDDYKFYVDRKERKCKKKAEFRSVCVHTTKVRRTTTEDTTPRNNTNCGKVDLFRHLYSLLKIS